MNGTATRWSSGGSGGDEHVASTLSFYLLCWGASAPHSGAPLGVMSAWHVVDMRSAAPMQRANPLITSLLGHWLNPCFKPARRRAV